MANSVPLLKLEQVSKDYPGPEGALSIRVLESISLAVDAGETVAFTGPSGSGKSTLLQIIGTLDRPTSGSVWLAGRDVNALDEMELSAVRNREIGFVFQSHFLLPQCTVYENVLLPTLAKVSSRRESSPVAGAGKEPSDARARRLLDRVGLGHRLAHKPGALSGGERQRAAVVRALINQPSLLLADEPTGSLDHAAAQQLNQLLIELNREEKVTLIVVTHALELARQMRRVLQLNNGHLPA